MIFILLKLTVLKRKEMVVLFYSLSGLTCSFSLFFLAPAADFRYIVWTVFFRATIDVYAFFKKRYVENE